MMRASHFLLILFMLTVSVGFADDAEESKSLVRIELLGGNRTR